ncbi:MAG: hypothetical protein V1678_02015 [Candidatus Aenigmatarchaeota archaeon]
MRKIEIIKTYKEIISMENIVSDGKVYEAGVERKVKMLASGEDIGDVSVVKHPKENIFAVMNGHHAYEAFKRFGTEQIECSVIPDSVGPLFYLTERGLLQPSPLFTEYVRVPFKEMKEYLKLFLIEPEKLKKE